MLVGAIGGMDSFMYMLRCCHMCAVAVHVRRNSWYARVDPNAAIWDVVYNLSVLSS